MSSGDKGRFCNAFTPQACYLISICTPPYPRCCQICLKFELKVCKVAVKIMSEIKVKILIEVSSNLSNAQVKDLTKVSSNMSEIHVISLNLDGNPGRDLA